MTGTDTNVPLTEDEIRARALELTRTGATPALGVRALMRINDAIRAARAADEASRELLLQCDSPVTDEVLEITGAMEFWDVVGAIQLLTRSTRAQRWTRATTSRWGSRRSGTTN